MRSVGDAQEFMRQLPDQQVHAAIVDPPWDIYGTGHIWLGDARKWMRPRDEVPEECVGYPTVESVSLAASLATLRDKLVKGGYLATFLPQGNLLWDVLDQFKADGWRRERIVIWDKVPWGAPIGMGGFWRNAYEPILFLTNGSARKLNRVGSYPALLRQRPKHTRTAKPTELYRVLIEATTEPGDLVVDPWCGADPLAPAAQATGRRWLSNDILTPEQVAAQLRER